jgi:hypothetical protein
MHTAPLFPALPNIPALTLQKEKDYSGILFYNFYLKKTAT